MRGSFISLYILCATSLVIQSLVDVENIVQYKVQFYIYDVYTKSSCVTCKENFSESWSRQNQVCGHLGVTTLLLIIAGMLLPILKTLNIFAVLA